MTLPDDGFPARGTGNLLDQFLSHAEPGQATLMRFLIDEGMVTVFAVREDEEHVATLPAEPMIQARSALMITDQVGLIVILARIEGEVYETWLNRYFEGIGLEECLDDLAQQEKLLFSFYVDDSEPARLIWMPNLQRDQFAEYQRAVAGLPPWSMEAFNMARMRAIQRFPSVQSLWEACGD